jgi:hypothetical protein
VTFLVRASTDKGAADNSRPSIAHIAPNPAIAQQPSQFAEMYMRDRSARFRSMSASHGAIFGGQEWDT